MIMGPFFKIEFISTSISCSDSDSSCSLLLFDATLLSLDLAAPPFPTRATPSSSALGLTTTFPPFPEPVPSEGIILRPATGLPSDAAAAAGASWALTLCCCPASAATSSTMGFCFAAAPMAFSCSSWILATRSARFFSSASTASRASLSWRVWMAATVRV